MTRDNRDESTTVGVGFAVGLALVAALLFLPSFSTLPFDKEEARRAIPAREMIASGDWVVPTIWSRTYLSKPPLYFWLVVASALPDGVVDEAATRLPSVGATIATALLVAVFGARVGGRRTGRAAALLFLCTLIVFEKGNLGELEAVFGLAVFACLGFLWLGLDGPWTLTLASGLCLGAALLTKGPPALVFYVTAVAGIVWAGNGRAALRSPRTWLPAALGAALASVWVVLLLRRFAGRDLLVQWSGEVARAGGFRWTVYLAERGDYLITVLLGLFPGSLLCLAAVGTPAWRRVSREPAVRFALVPILAGIAFFLLPPGTRTRYAYPLVPLVCVVAARVLDTALAEGGAESWRRVRRVGYAIAALGVLVVVAAGYLLFGSIGDVDGFGATGHALVLATLVLSALAVARLRGGARAAPLVLCFAILATVRLLQLTEIVPRIARAQTGIDTARRIEDAVGETEPLGIAVWDHFNILAYVRRPMVWADPRDARPGDVLLIDRDEDLARAERDGLRFDTLFETTLDRHRPVAVIRVLASSAAP